MSPADLYIWAVIAALAIVTVCLVRACAKRGER